MAALGPWPAPTDAFPLVVAVSGGADSTALAVLAAGWAAARRADAHALVVDHGLRAGSDAEALLVAGRCRALGLSARILRLPDLHPGSALGERSRDARYAALEAACAELGALDLLLGHHRGDQAETIAMRRRSGSGPDGLAGMARITEHGLVRRLRPLLDVDPARLRATLRARDVSWVEDPSNYDRRFERARLRAELDPATVAILADAAGRSGVLRQRRASAAAGWLARHATLRPEGFAVLRRWPPDDPPDPAVLSALVRCIAGARYPPAATAAARLFAVSGATLAGVMIVPAGRLGPPGARLLVREPAAVAAPEPLRHGSFWDRRFLLSAPGNPDGLLIGALGVERVADRRELPAAVLRVLPAIRRGGVLLAVPHLGWAASGDPSPFRATFRPPVAATEGSAFDAG